MTTIFTLFSPKTRLGAAALAVSILLAGTVQADSTFPIAVKVNAIGLDLRQEAGIRDLYIRLKNAADAVCNNIYRVGLQPVADYTDCYEKALGSAVQSLNRPQLTQIYLSSRTLRNLNTHGVQVSLLAAAAQRSQ